MLAHTEPYASYQAVKHPIAKEAGASAPQFIDPAAWLDALVRQTPYSTALADDIRATPEYFQISKRALALGVMLLSRQDTENIDTPETLEAVANQPGLEAITPDEVVEEHNQIEFRQKLTFAFGQLLESAVRGHLDGATWERPDTKFIQYLKSLKEDFKYAGIIKRADIVGRNLARKIKNLVPSGHQSVILRQVRFGYGYDQNKNIRRAEAWDEAQENALLRAMATGIVPAKLLTRELMEYFHDAAVTFDDIIAYYAERFERVPNSATMVTRAMISMKTEHARSKMATKTRSTLRRAIKDGEDEETIKGYIFDLNEEMCLNEAEMDDALKLAQLIELISLAAFRKLNTATGHIEPHEVLTYLISGLSARADFVQITFPKGNKDIAELVEEVREIFRHPLLDPLLLHTKKDILKRFYSLVADGIVEFNIIELKADTRAEEASTPLPEFITPDITPHYFYDVLHTYVAQSQLNEFLMETSDEASLVLEKIKMYIAIGKMPFVFRDSNTEELARDRQKYEIIPRKYPQEQLLLVDGELLGQRADRYHLAMVNNVQSQERTRRWRTNQALSLLIGTIYKIGMGIDGEQFERILAARREKDKQ